MEPRALACPACGRSVLAEAAYCTQCGSSLADDPRSGGNALVWETAFPLLTNRFVLLDFAKIIVLTYVICVAIVGAPLALTGSADAVGGLALLFAVLMAGFAVLCALIMLVFFGNRCPARFAVSAEGVRAQMTSRRGLAANRVAIVAGLLTGRPGVAGAGLLGMSGETIEIGWGDVRRVREYRSLRVITISNSWRTVVRLYCSAENYAAVAAAIRGWAPHATA